MKTLSFIERIKLKYSNSFKLKVFLRFLKENNQYNVLIKTLEPLLKSKTIYSIPCEKWLFVSFDWSRIDFYMKERKSYNNFTDWHCLNRKWNTFLYLNGIRSQYVCSNYNVNEY